MGIVSTLALEHIHDHAEGFNICFMLFIMWLGKLMIFSQILFPELWSSYTIYLAVIRVKWRNICEMLKTTPVVL